MPLVGQERDSKPGLLDRIQVLSGENTKHMQQLCLSKMHKIFRQDHTAHTEVSTSSYPTTKKSDENTHREETPKLGGMSGI